MILGMNADIRSEDTIVANLNSASHLNKATLSKTNVISYHETLAEFADDASTFDDTFSTNRNIVPKGNAFLGKGIDIDSITNHQTSLASDKVSVTNLCSFTNEYSSLSLAEKKSFPKASQHLDALVEPDTNKIYSGNGIIKLVRLTLDCSNLL